MNWQAKWIHPGRDTGDACPLFQKDFIVEKPVKTAVLSITALGVYEARLNRARVGQFVLAPGWTDYEKRLQFQQYEVSDLLRAQNTLSVVVGKGWYRSPMPGWTPSEYQAGLCKRPAGLLAQLDIEYADGTRQTLVTDGSWQTGESGIRFSEIYDGETFDANFTVSPADGAVVFDGPWDTLIPQQGEDVQEQERVAAARIFRTPKGETVVDFGQEVTGYAEVTVQANGGEELVLSHAEVLDRDGNFYTENYRSAKAKARYLCLEGRCTYQPRLTYFGFRYLRIDQFPGGAERARPEDFTAVVLHSVLRRTGTFACSDPLLNKLYENVIWGQKGNFVDVPTDCPQRDERLGWTGDAQVFIRTACLNFDTEKFYTKWLADLAASQHKDGGVGHVIPDLLQDPRCSAAWGDAATVCPWELYLAYGNPAILAAQFDSMKKWVDYITAHTTAPCLWLGGQHFGDWLGLDAKAGSYKGATRDDFVASAFYAHSTALLLKTGKILGRDVSAYEALYQKILCAFRKEFPTCTTQTECVLAAHFGLAPDCQAAADQLAGLVRDAGVQLRTGFVGTPYLLHVLSDYGYADLAYSLLLRRDYPSWLYPVTKGATTIWEHWDGIRPNGEFWDKAMNSFNHYAYGAVADWLYGDAAGIQALESAPGYARVRIAPLPDARLDWLRAGLKTRHGAISSAWEKQNDQWKYEIETPVPAEIVIAGVSHKVGPGHYLFYSEIQQA
jgi:alpha-L-rhamnosidase